MRARPAVWEFVPIAAWLPACSWKSARRDMVAGIAAAGLLIPEGIAYTGIAGVPPQTDLYAACVGMFAYAIFGISRQFAVTSSSAAMLAALVAPIALADSTRYTMLVSANRIAAGGCSCLVEYSS